jgi:hypothetical protein
MAKEKKLSSLDRVILQAMGENRTVGRSDDPAVQRWPELWTWLSTIYIGSEKMKKPSVLSITLQPDGVLARIVDNDLCCSVQVNCMHLDGIFDRLEEALNRPDLPVSTWGKKEPELRTRKRKS